MKQLLPALTLMMLAACSPREQVATQPTSVMNVPRNAPAGAYTLDKAHANLTFRVSHMGFSNYTASFKNFDAQLQFDPANLGASSVTATVDPKSLDLNTPPAGFLDQLMSDTWFNAAQFPQMSFKSTKVDATGANTVHVIGDLTLHGVTKPVSFDATFNGGYPGMSMDPHARIGFSAHGSLKRSDFGIAFGIPQPGSNMGVGDEVEFAIESEFSGPAFTGADASSPK